MNREISISRIVVDFVLLVSCGIPLLIFHEFVTPYKRGFYCNDDSIRYPYRDSTITRHVLIVIGLVVPSVMIVFTEVFRTLAWERKCEHVFPAYKFRNRPVHRLIVRLYIFLGYYLLGVVFNQLMVDIAKYTIGRQRPHFIAVCKPDRGAKDCAILANIYIDDFNCTSGDKYRVQESMLSFYSGHASFSFYAAWFMALYLQARLYQPLFSRVLLPVVQFILFAFATFVAYTRVSDYKHHWSDVLVGAAFGSTIGIITALFVAEVFERREIPSLPETRDGVPIASDDLHLVEKPVPSGDDLESARGKKPGEKARTSQHVEMTASPQKTGAVGAPGDERFAGRPPFDQRLLSTDSSTPLTKCAYDTNGEAFDSSSSR